MPFVLVVTKSSVPAESSSMMGLKKKNITKKILKAIIKLQIFIQFRNFTAQLLDILILKMFLGVYISMFFTKYI